MRQKFSSVKPFNSQIFIVFFLAHQTGSMSLERADSLTSEVPNTSTAGGVWNTMTSITRQRVKLNMKLLGNIPTQQPNMKEDKPTYREQFVSPQMSMISYFLMKVRTAEKKKFVTREINL